LLPLGQRRQNGRIELAQRRCARMIEELIAAVARLRSRRCAAAHRTDACIDRGIVEPAQQLLPR
jgi:hypothetical protein